MTLCNASQKCGSLRRSVLRFLWPFWYLALGHGDDPERAASTRTSQNRMASCTYQGQTTTFTYGSDGLRRSMTVGGVTTDYAYDGTMLVRELQINQQTGLLAPSVTYMIGPMGPCCRINEQNQTEGYYPAGVTSTTPLSRGVTRWYVYDGLGCILGPRNAARPGSRICGLYLFRLIWEGA
jgi:hypothetical protein